MALTLCAISVSLWWILLRGTLITETQRTPRLYRERQLTCFRDRLLDYSFDLLAEETMGPGEQARLTPAKRAHQRGALVSLPLFERAPDEINRRAEKDNTEPHESPNGLRRNRIDDQSCCRKDE
jgi:hypothetical protein